MAFSRIATCRSMSGTEAAVNERLATAESSSRRLDTPPARRVLSYSTVWSLSARVRKATSRCRSNSRSWKYAVATSLTSVMSTARRPSSDDRYRANAASLSRRTRPNRSSSHDIVALMVVFGKTRSSSSSLRSGGCELREIWFTDDDTPTPISG